MSANIPTVGELFDHLKDQLQLQWAAGRGAGDKRFIKHGENQPVDIVGYFNPIHSSQVHILDNAEMAYLESLKGSVLDNALHNLFSDTCLAVLISNTQKPMPDMQALADKRDIALFISSLGGEPLVDDLRYYLSRTLAEKLTMHGVFMEVISIGLLLTGDSGVGKSELALELITRGHRLIADDSPVFTRIAPDIIQGAAPPTIQDFLEVRGLGILNIRQMYGNSAVKETKYLRQIIDLKFAGKDLSVNKDRLRSAQRTMNVLGLEIPVFTLPVAPGRNLAVLVEAAARNHILRVGGYYAEEEIAARQRNYMDVGR